MKLLCVSDVVDERLYTLAARPRLADVDLVLAAGDLPGSYLEFLADLLEAPLYYVFGNHGEEIVHPDGKDPRQPMGCTNLEGRVAHHRRGKSGAGGGPTVGRSIAASLLLAGLGGSPRYRPGPYQYREGEMVARIARLAPRLLYNRLRYGRFLDLLLTHAPPRGIHDGTDQAHRGFRAFLLFMQVFRPRYLVHGHHYEYDRRTLARMRYGETWVVNAYGYSLLEVPDVP